MFLLLQVLLIPGMLLLFFGLSLLLLRVILDALLRQILFLFAHLFDSLKARLLLHLSSKRCLVAATVQDLRSWLLLRLQEARCVRVVHTEHVLSHLTLVVLSSCHLALLLLLGGILLGRRRVDNHL